jgi:carbon-monoxide dehydrogenase small subunit
MKNKKSQVGMGLPDCSLRHCFYEGAELAMEYSVLNLAVNGKIQKLMVRTNWTLAQVLRDQLGLLGTKIGCGEGECGACTVLMDGKSITSCLVFAVQAEGTSITTIEGLTSYGDGCLHPVQEAFVNSGAIQCGYCTPGMIMSTVALLKKYPDPTEKQIKEGLAGNLCRCTGYQKIFDAVKMASERMRGGLLLHE